MRLPKPPTIGDCCLQAVSRAWREASSDPAVLHAAFIRHWGIAAVRGEPRQTTFLHKADLSVFVKRHEVERTDTLQQLAVGGSGLRPTHDS